MKKKQKTDKRVKTVLKACVKGYSDERDPNRGGSADLRERRGDYIQTSSDKLAGATVQALRHTTDIKH